MSKNATNVSDSSLAQLFLSWASALTAALSPSDVWPVRYSIRDGACVKECWISEVSVAEGINEYSPP
ncbi:hypothetical protein Y032_0014g2331 [Ancylostoma ceylanicum]|uniref:Uncharacterized protein n=1 Tax=Ancylostoma ceylanicum TaxID=53326 RepID=A0A016V9M2_9BILA|nr:hypothetical protein Y032_0014g2331 [Ancylostoma ceylanicum]